MKRFFAIIFAALLLMAAVPFSALAEVETEEGYDYTRFKNDNITLNVYNWGLYIADGTDDSMDVIQEFEDLTGINVVYNTYDTNENLYAKLKTGGANYDVIIPSDYMIGKMIKEDMLEPLNFDNIPNYALIGSQYKDMPYDPQNAYSVPYTWGVVGIIYNTTMVDGTVDSWDIMWDEAYKGQILMFNNSRDAFAIAAKKAGLSMNPTTVEDVKTTAELLKKQKPLVQSYVMDEIFDKMEGGEAAIAPYYAGDAITMIDENPDLAFAIPKEGTNYFVDAMCIPKGCKNKEAAEMFINFMCETQVALANNEFIGYSTPQTEAAKLLPEELQNSPIAYPDEAVLANTETMVVLSDEINAAMDKEWSNIRSFDEGKNLYFLPLILLVAVCVAALCIWRKKVKKERNNY